MSQEGKKIRREKRGRDDRDRQRETEKRQKQLRRTVRGCARENTALDADLEVPAPQRCGLGLAAAPPVRLEPRRLRGAVRLLPRETQTLKYVGLPV